MLGRSGRPVSGAFRRRLAIDALHEVALERDVGQQPLQPARQPPGAAAEQHDDAGRDRRRAPIRSTLAPQAQERPKLARFEALLAEGVAAASGLLPDSLRAHRRQRRRPSPRSRRAAHPRAIRRCTAPSARSLVMDEALVFLRGGVDALRRHPPI